MVDARPMDRRRRDPDLAGPPASLPSSAAARRPALHQLLARRLRDPRLRRSARIRNSSQGLDWSPPYPCPTHTVLPIPHELMGRKVAVVTDEEVSDRLTPSPNAFMWIVDITDEAHPVPISTWRVPHDKPFDPRVLVRRAPAAGDGQRQHHPGDLVRRRAARGRHLEPVPPGGSRQLHADPRRRSEDRPVERRLRRQVARPRLPDRPAQRARHPRTHRLRATQARDVRARYADPIAGEAAGAGAALGPACGAASDQAARKRHGAAGGGAARRGGGDPSVLRLRQSRHGRARAPSAATRAATRISSASSRISPISGRWSAPPPFAAAITCSAAPCRRWTGWGPRTSLSAS